MHFLCDLIIILIENYIEIADLISSFFNIILKNIGLRNYFYIHTPNEYALYHTAMNTLYISIYPYLIHELQYVVVGSTICTISRSTDYIIR